MKAIVLEDSKTVAEERTEPRGIEVSKLSEGVTLEDRVLLDFPSMVSGYGASGSSILTSCKDYVEKVTCFFNLCVYFPITRSDIFISV